MTENRLVIYSAAEQKYCAGLLEGFRERHPGIEVEFVFGISVALHERYLAETAAQQPGPDVFWSSAMDLQLRLALDGHALAHRSAETGALPPEARYQDLAWSTTVEPLMSLVNRGLLNEQLPAGSLSEITAVLRQAPGCPVACYDIERNGLGFLALLHESRRGDEFDAFLRALAASRPRAFGSNPPLVEEVASGRAALTWHVLGSYAVRAARDHASLAIAASRATPLAVSRVAFIPRRASNPDAARLFVDYLLSTDGQRRLGEAGLYPIHGATGAAIAIDRGLEDLLDGPRRRRLLERWQAALAGKPQP